MNLQTKNRQGHFLRRFAALTLLGGQCVGCGCSNSGLLQLDHAEDDGHLESSAGASLVQRVLRGTQRLPLQLLCPNCHHLRTHRLSLRQVRAEARRHNLRPPELRKKQINQIAHTVAREGRIPEAPACILIPVFGTAPHSTVLQQELVRFGQKVLQQWQPGLRLPRFDRSPTPPVGPSSHPQSRTSACQIP